MNKTFFTTKFYIIVAFSFAFFSLYAWTRPVEAPEETQQVTANDEGTNFTIQSTKQFRFAAVGDFDYNDNTRSVFDAIAKSNTDFSIGLGDYSYDKTSDEYQWCELVTSKLGANYPFQLVAGNHDVHENGNKQDIDRFASCLPNKMPAFEGIYAQQGFFDYGRMARFITIAPALTINERGFDYQKGTKEYEWLSKTIDDARADRLNWVVVSMHKNCISVGEKSCEVGTDVIDLLIEKKVDLVLQGHEHLYGRSHQLTFNEECSTISTVSFQSACIIEATNNVYKKGQGTMIAIVGTGGAELRNVDMDRADIGYFADWSGANIGPAYGPLIVDVTKSSLKARFVGADGVEHDSFEVSL